MLPDGERGERLFGLLARTSTLLSSGEAEEAVLGGWAQALADHLAPARAIVWTSRRDGGLQRAASASASDGTEACLGSGPTDEDLTRLARERRPQLTQDWAAFPLVVEDRTVGVLGLVALRPMSEAVLRELTPLAENLGQYVDRKAMARELAEARRRLDAARSTGEAGPGVLLDITDDAEADQARSEAQRLDHRSQVLETVLSSIVDFAYSFDRDGRFVFANKPLLDLWGLTLQEAAGKNFFDLQYPAELATKLQAQIQQVFETKRPLSDETPYQSPTGVDGVYEYIFQPVLGADGSVALVAGSTRDISERKRMEHQLRDADRRKDEFLAMLAHELRTPLTPISNALHTLAEPYVDRQHAQAGVALMQRQLAHVLRLVDDLVDVSRISRGTITLRMERVLLEDIVAQAVEAARPLYLRRGQELTVTLPPTPVHLEADGARLAQIVGNLLTNAAKYSDPGSHVCLSAELQPPGLSLRVKDDGIGIAAEHMPRIFDMFSQVDTSLERSQGGLGLGLTLVKSLVSMHGGTVAAHSAGLGRGSEFVIHLPEVAAAPRPLPAAPCRPVRSPIGLRIVVAEDNREAAESLGLWLEYQGCEVHLAFDGKEAVAAIERVRPDLALIDIGMPSLSGHEACRQIRGEAWGKDLRLIALTGWSQESDRQRTAQAGFDGHLVKPLDQVALHALLASLPAR